LEIMMNTDMRKITETFAATFCPATYATQANKSFERAVEATEATLNFAVRQNAELLAGIKKAVAGTPVEKLPVFELAGEAFDGYIAVQKDLLGIAKEHSTAVTDAIHASGTDVHKAKDEFVSLVEASMNRAMAVRNRFVEYVAAQVQAATAAAKLQPGTAEDKAADSVRRAMDNAITAQNEILSFATRHVKGIHTQA
jgi:hypothetical protein